eukprot:7385305-Prymnesium_polylepis.1
MWTACHDGRLRLLQHSVNAGSCSSRAPQGNAQLRRTSGGRLRVLRVQPSVHVGGHRRRLPRPRRAKIVVCARRRAPAAAADDPAPASAPTPAVQQDQLDPFDVLLD